MKKEGNNLKIILGILVIVIIMFFLVQNNKLPVISEKIQLVHNPSFEIQNLSSWNYLIPEGFTDVGSRSMLYQMRWANETAHTGSKSMFFEQVTNSPPNEYGLGTTYKININKSNQYMISFYYKYQNLKTWSDGLTNKFGIGIKVYNSSNSMIEEKYCAAQWSTANSTNWENKECTVTFSDNANYIIPRVTYYTTQGTVWIDDISIREK